MPPRGVWKRTGWLDLGLLKSRFGKWGGSVGRANRARHVSIKQARPQAYLSSGHVMSVMKRQSLKSIGIKSSIEFRGTELSVEKKKCCCNYHPDQSQFRVKNMQTHHYANSKKKLLFKPMFQHCRLLLQMSMRFTHLMFYGCYTASQTYTARRRHGMTDSHATLVWY